jgi:serine O-acetyltransferase
MASKVTFTTSLNPKELSAYVTNLLNLHFPDGDPILPAEISATLPRALERLEMCMTGIQRKYFNEGGKIRFDHMNSDHMATFLYLLANTSWKQTSQTRIATKLFYLNKLMNSIDLYFSVALPEVFFLVHPVGSVVGNATYGNYMAIYQGCTIGAVDGAYPTFGEGTILYAGATVLGDTRTGNDVIFGARAFVIGSEIPSNSVVTGSFPNHKISPTKRSVRQRIFDPITLAGRSQE